MCVAFFTLEHPDYALVLCSNRDESLARPTQPACFHSFGAHQPANVLSGIDVEAGGTWLGLSRTGKLALLTNITEPSTSFAPTASRGRLLSSFLTTEEPTHPLDAAYAGFNLLLLAPAARAPLSFDALYVTNHGAGGRITRRALSDAQRRYGALSNGVDGEDDWPKVRHGLALFQHVLDTFPATTPSSSPDVDLLAERLLDLLTWRSSPPPRDNSELRHTIEAAPIRIGNPETRHATRLATVVVVQRTGHVLFIERDRWQLVEGEPVLADPASQRVFRFRLACCE